MTTKREKMVNAANRTTRPELVKRLAVFGASLNEFPNSTSARRYLRRKEAHARIFGT